MSARRFCDHDDSSCPIAIGFILTWTHRNWDATFYVSAAIYFMGSFFWLFLDPVTPLEEAPAGH